MSSRASKENSTELHVFFMSTTKLEKIAQLNAQAANRGYPVLFLPVTSLGEPAHSPEELSGSFQLNKNKKLMSCALHLTQFSYEQVLAAVEPLGISRADLEQKKVRLYGCAEDSGMSFDRDRAHPEKTKEFVDMFFNTGPDGPYKTDVDKELVRSLERFIGWEKPLIKGGPRQRKPFPGVETVRVMGAAGGVDNFFRLTEQVMKKLNIPVEPPPRSTNRLDFVDDSILGAFEWHPEQVKDLSISNLNEGEGKSRSTYFRHPVEGDEKLTYTRTAPTGRFSQGHTMSREQLGELYQPQARGEALGFLVDTFGIKKIKPSSWEARIGNRRKTPGAEERISDYTVSVLPADKDYQHHKLADAVGKAIHSKDMHVQFPKREGARARVWSELGVFQHMLDSSDAVMFLPSGSDQKVSPRHGHKDPDRNLELHHAASQFLEHVTLYPGGKPKLGVFVEEQEGDYKRFIRPFTELFNRGAFGDRPTKLIVPAKSVDEGMKLLESHRKQYRPVLTHPEAQSEAKLLKKPDTYHVGVFLSASMEGIYEDKAFALGERIQQAGMGLTYGAADRNAMGAVFKGFMESRKKHGNGGAVVLGSTTRVIAATECEHGTKPHDLPDEHFYLAPNIPKRKEFLIKNSDAFVVVEGGVGTFDELLTLLYLKKTGSDLMKNKPVVVCESAYTQGSMYKQVLDDFFGSDSSKVNEKTMRAKGVFIVKPTEKLPEGSGERRLFDYDIDKAMNILESHRANGWAHDVQRRREQAAGGASVTH